MYCDFLAMRSENKRIFKAELQGLKRRILAGYGIVTENGYFTDFELILERKNNPMFLTIP